MGSKKSAPVVQPVYAAKPRAIERTAEEAQEYVLIYCVEGEGWFRLGDRRYEVVANQFFILPKYQAHAYGSKAETPWTIYWIHFDGAKAAFFSGFPLHSTCSPFREGSLPANLSISSRLLSHSVSSSMFKGILLRVVLCVGIHRERMAQF